MPTSFVFRRICFFGIIGIFLGVSTLIGTAQPVRETVTFPVVFAENVGQWHKDVLYGGLCSATGFTREGIYWRPQRKTLIPAPKNEEVPRDEKVGKDFVRFVRPSPRMSVRAAQGGDGPSRWYLGSDSSRWLRDAPIVRTLEYHNVWDSVDVIYEGMPEGIRQTVRIRPGADRREIAMATRGAPDLFGEYTQQNDTPLNAKGAMGERVQTLGNDLLVEPDTTEFSTFIGGTRVDDIRSIRVHTDGSIYVAGSTNSVDFPFLRNRTAFESYIFRLDCDGRTMRFCSIYARDPLQAPTTEYELYESGMNLRRDGHAFLVCNYFLPVNTTTFPYPLTANALETRLRKTRRVAVILEFDDTGLLQYASMLGQGKSALEDDGDVFLSRIAFTSKDEVLLTGKYQYPNGGEFEYLTPGTINPLSDSHGSFLIKLSNDMSALIWGTKILNLGGKCQSSDLFLAIDSKDRPIVYGMPGDSTIIPLVNAFQTHKGTTIVQKLTADGSAYVFSSYLGGTGFQTIWAENICVDRDDRLILTGETASSDYPIVGFSPPFDPPTDGYITIVSTEGALVRSRFFGEMGEYEPYYVDTDINNNVYVYGQTHAAQFPLKNPWFKRPENSTRVVYLTLSVLDSNLDSLLFSTFWPPRMIGQRSFENTLTTHLLAVSKSGYVHFGGYTWEPMPAYNAIREVPYCPIYVDSCYDGFLVRMYLPFAGQNYVHATLEFSDSLRYETTLGALKCGRFPLIARLRNSSAMETADLVYARLQLPAGVVLDPPGQSLAPTLTRSLSPGDTASFTWWVRIASFDTATTVLHFPVTVYQGTVAENSCERPFTRTAFDVPVQRYATTVSALDCTLSAQDSLAAASPEDTLVGNPFPVTCRLQNTGTARIHVQSVILERVGPASAIYANGFLAPAWDSVRVGGSLEPGETLQCAWSVRAPRVPFERELALRVAVLDTFGVRVPMCESRTRVPALRGVTCALASVDTVRFDHAAGAYTPNPLVLNLRLDNTLDTTRIGMVSRIDLFAAKHLRLAPGETSAKSSPPVAAHGSIGSRWLFEVIPHPTAPVDDTLVVWYSAPGWPAERSCAHIVRIVPPLQAVSCALAAPTVTVTPAGRYAPDTMTVTWTLTNGGETTVPATRARLAISGDTTWCLDPLEQAVPSLAAKQSAVRTWRLAPPTSPFGRGIALAVTARDSVQNEIARCASTLELPRVWPVVECTLTGPDTVHYLSATDSYQPDPSDLSYNVTNRVDTTITLTAALDLASAPHLAPAAGETGTRALGQLAPRATANTVFRVTVDPRPETPVTDMPNAITTAHYGETADDVGCSTLTTIEGREKVYAAACFTAGHDTSWADVGNEDIIPHPLQMRLGIVNTGNEPLAGVTAVVILPAGYILTTPPDSIQSYPAIAPGDTGRREWLMEVNREHPVEGAGTVRWTWSNARTSGECTREAVLLQGSPQGIALSKWRLDFRAERGKALPAAESVNIWTGNNNTYQWASASADGWLSVSSGVLTGRGTVTIQPNTTALPEGFYEGTVAIVTSEYARPTPIEVGYEIYTLASTPAPPAPATPTLTCSPNPVRPGGVLEVRYTSAAAGAGPVRLRLLDALGREAIAAATAQTTARMRLALPANLAAGLYFVEATSREGRTVRGVAVVP